MTHHPEGLTLEMRVSMVSIALRQAETADQCRTIISRAQGLRDDLDAAYHQAAGPASANFNALRLHKDLLHLYFERIEALTEGPVVGVP